MALINGALQIGRSALAASQTALTVTGNNMANAATPSYSRQQVHLAPTQTNQVTPGQYAGTGVSVYDIRRQVDDALNGRIRTALGDSSSHFIQQQTMTRVETIFNELTDQDLSTRLNQFFESWSTLQTQPQNSAARNVVLQEGAGLANFIGQTRTDLAQVRSDLDSQVRFYVRQADNLITQVAGLNGQIVVAESGRAGSAAALRDQRDDLLRQLAELVNIRTAEVEGGSVNVFIGNDPAVQYTEARGLNYVEEEDANGAWTAQVTFGDNNQPISLTSGKIHGLITARDQQIGGVLTELDTWAKSVIYEVNRLHTRGRGLTGFSQVTAVNQVTDPTASLASLADTELPWAVDNGVFHINVIDSQSNSKTETIQVEIGMDGTDTTLNDLAAAIDALDDLNASVDAAGTLTISAASAGVTFGFSAPENGQGATNVLAVLGINTFFSGENGTDIALRSDLVSNPSAVAASATGLAGDGSIAGQIADLAVTGVTSLNDSTIGEYFRGMIGQFAADSKAAQDNYAAADVVRATLESERQSISGVSMDEEAIHMITFQRAFQGASRYVSIIDQMLDEVINLIR